MGYEVDGVGEGKGRSGLRAGYEVDEELMV